MAIKEIGTNLEAYRMYARTGQEAGPSRTVNQAEMAEVGLGPEIDDIGALSWDDKTKKGKGKAPTP